MDDEVGGDVGACVDGEAESEDEKVVRRRDGNIMFLEEFGCSRDDGWVGEESAVGSKRQWGEDLEVGEWVV